MQIRLLVACREELEAHALCRGIVAAEGRIWGEAADLTGAHAKAAAQGPDVAVIECRSDEEEASWPLLTHLAGGRGIPVLLACEAYPDGAITRFIQRGASGCLLKSSTPLLYAKAVLAVQQGDSWYPRAELLRALRNQLSVDPAASLDVLQHEALLTRREREILALVGAAKSNKEIARQLEISDLTVKTHLHHIYVKLQRSGRFKAFVSNGVLAPRSP